MWPKNGGSQFQEFGVWQAWLWGYYFENLITNVTGVLISQGAYHTKRGAYFDSAILSRPGPSIRNDSKYDQAESDLDYPWYPLGVPGGAQGYPGLQGVFPVHEVHTYLASEGFKMTRRNQTSTTPGTPWGTRGAPGYPRV